MADVVIVVGTKRGNESVPAIEIKQMCVSNTSRILTPSGYMPASALQIGDEVIGVVKNLVSKGVIKKKMETIGEAKKIVLSNGVSVILGNHPVLLWNDRWISSDDLKPGDRVSIVAKTIVKNGKTWKEKISEISKDLDGYCRLTGTDITTLRNMSDYDVAQNAQVAIESVYKMKKRGIIRIRMAARMGFKIRYIRSKNGSELDLDALDYNRFGWWLGLLASDGNVKRTKTNWVVRCEMVDKSAIKRFSSVLKRSGIVNHCGYDGNRWRCEAASFCLTEIVCRLGIVPCKSRIMDLGELYDLGSFEKSQFLAGYIDGDGSFSVMPYAVRICSASHKTAMDLKDILLSIGVIASVSQGEGTGEVFGYKCDTKHWNVKVARREAIDSLIKQVCYSIKLPKSVKAIVKNTRPLKGDCWWTKVVSTENVGSIPLINFQVGETETFIVEDVVTHNCGRAGRKQGGDACLAHVIVEDDRAADIQSSLEQGTNMEVKSPFGTTDGLYFHLMPEIASGRITDIATAEGWFSRSLAAFQGVKVKFQKVFEKMEAEGSITQIHGVIRPTKVGLIASDLYFHPGDVQAWKDNFTKLFEMGLENDNAAIAWALGTRTYVKSQGDFGNHRFVLGEYKSALPIGLDIEKGTMIQVVLWWCAMGGPSAGRLRNQMLELREDMGRIKRALVRLDKEVAGWDKGTFFDEMEIMVRKGVSVELVPLCKLPGITKGRADFLYNSGARDADSIEGILPNIEDELDEPFLTALKGIIDGVRRKSR